VGIAVGTMESATPTASGPANPSPVSLPRGGRPLISEAVRRLDSPDSEDAGSSHRSHSQHSYHSRSQSEGPSTSTTSLGRVALALSGGAAAAAAAAAKRSVAPASSAQAAQAARPSKQPPAAATAARSVVTLKFSELAAIDEMRTREELGEEEEEGEDEEEGAGASGAAPQATSVFQWARGGEPTEAGHTGGQHGPAGVGLELPTVLRRARDAASTAAALPTPDPAPSLAPLPVAALGGGVAHGPGPSVFLGPGSRGASGVIGLAESEEAESGVREHWAGAAPGAAASAASGALAASPADRALRLSASPRTYVPQQPAGGHGPTCSTDGGAGTARTSSESDGVSVAIGVAAGSDRELPPRLRVASRPLAAASLERGPEPAGRSASGRASALPGSVPRMPYEAASSCEEGLPSSLSPAGLGVHALAAIGLQPPPAAPAAGAPPARAGLPRIWRVSAASSNGFSDVGNTPLHRLRPGESADDVRIMMGAGAGGIAVPSSSREGSRSVSSAWGASRSGERSHRLNRPGAASELQRSGGGADSGSNGGGSSSLVFRDEDEAEADAAASSSPATFTCNPVRSAGAAGVWLSPEAASIAGLRQRSRTSQPSSHSAADTEEESGELLAASSASGTAAHAAGAGKHRLLNDRPAATASGRRWVPGAGFVPEEAGERDARLLALQAEQVAVLLAMHLPMGPLTLLLRMLRKPRRSRDKKRKLPGGEGDQSVAATAEFVWLEVTATYTEEGLICVYREPL